MDSVLLDLGYIKIYWYSVMIFMAMLVGGYIILNEAKKWLIPEDFIINLFFFLIPIAIIGARLYYVLFNLDYYMANKGEIFRIWEGGLAIHGGIIFGLIWVIIYTKKWRVNTKRLLDIMAVGLIIGQAIGRWGNFFNGEAHGPITTLANLQKLLIPQFIIDGMFIDGNYYHPTFLYESLWCLIGFLALLIIRRGKYIKIGQITGIYCMWYGIGRFLIESQRTDSLMYNGLKTAQIASVVMFVVGFLVVIINGRNSKFENRYNDMENVDEIVY